MQGQAPTPIVIMCMAIGEVAFEPDMLTSSKFHPPQEEWKTSYLNSECLPLYKLDNGVGLKQQTLGWLLDRIK